jgi:N-methylhydantoinase A/oxoprolinase/acetone carboxylase beta subunit
VDGDVLGLDVPVYDLERLAPGQTLDGPCVVLNKTSTVVVDPKSTLVTTPEGNIDIITEPAVRTDASQVD